MRDTAKRDGSDVGVDREHAAAAGARPEGGAAGNDEEHREATGQDHASVTVRQHAAVYRDRVHLLASVVAAFALPGFTLATTEPKGGQLLEGTFPGTVRPGYVYLPPAFDPARRYPVAYLLHGMPGSPSEYPDGTELGSYADMAIANGKLAPFIGVMPAAGTTPRYNGEWAGAVGVRDRRPRRAVGRRDVTDDRGACRPRARRSVGRRLRRVRHRASPSARCSVQSSRGAATSHRFTTGRSVTLLPCTLAANDPSLLARGEGAHPSYGRARASSFPRGRSTATGSREARRRRSPESCTGSGFPSRCGSIADRGGEWREQLDAGLKWAFPA